MSKIIKYGIFALVVYFVIQKAPLVVENISELGAGLSRKGSPVSQTHCLPAAERASDTFSSGLRDFSRPPFDLDAWDMFLEEVQRTVYTAENRCDCPRDSCQRASQAISELNGLIVDFDNSLRGEGVSLNPARRQDTINRMLTRARELDRQGN